MYETQINSINPNISNWNRYELNVRFISLHNEHYQNKTHVQLVVETLEEFPQRLLISLTDYWRNSLSKYNLVMGVEMVVVVSIRVLSGIKNEKEYHINKFNLIGLTIRDEYIKSITSMLPDASQVFGKKEYNNLDAMMVLTREFFEHLQAFKSKSIIEYGELLNMIDVRIDDLRDSKLDTDTPL